MVSDKNIKNRRIKALERLQNQLSIGFKKDKYGIQIKLNDRDISRINSEIVILETRI